MVEYNSKTPTLFKRGHDGLVTGVLSDERFNMLRYWTVTEKMDGMSVILSFTPDDWGIHGRTPNTKFTEMQHSFLFETITNTIYNMRKHPVYDGKRIDIYAELIGPRSNGNSYDLKECELYVFDICINGFWLDWTNVESVSTDAKLTTVPLISKAAIPEIIHEVRDTPRDRYFEGIVARSDPYLFNNKGDRLRFKLKVSDF